MTKEEIQKNSEHWYNKYKDAEKRITDLENKIADIKANCDLAIEGRDIKIKELEQENAGLKAGRPQWHDLRKDPNDLPKDKEYVLVYTNLTNYYVAEKVENHFMSKGWGFIPMSTVIAWCEIPTFDKE